MIKRAKPGDIIWCAEGGAVKQVEVARRQDAVTKIRIKYPYDDIMHPWYCWNGYLFRSRKAALNQAHRQLQNQLSDRIADLAETKRDIQEIKQSIQQLEEELQEA